MTATQRAASRDETDIDAAGKPKTRGEGPRLDMLRMAQAAIVPVASGAGFLLLWELLVAVLNVPKYLLPPPSVFIPELIRSWPLISLHARATAFEMVVGFVAAAGISVPLAWIITSNLVIERAVYPIIAYFQTMPKMAIAPLFIVWFGLGMFSKVLTVFLVCFFPILVNSMSGFRALDPRILYITRSMGASRWQTFLWVRLPSALPFIFSGLNVAVIMAVTGAVVAEFVGSNEGLGYLLLRGSASFDLPLMFAVLVCLGFMGLAGGYILRVSESLFMPWKRKNS